MKLALAALLCLFCLWEIEEHNLHFVEQPCVVEGQICKTLNYVLSFQQAMLTMLTISFSKT